MTQRGDNSSVTSVPTEAAPAGGLGSGADVSKRRGPMSFLAFLVLLTGAFIQPLASLAAHVAHSQLHSYILLVPFVSAYLLYNRRSELPRGHVSSPGWAIMPLAGGLAALVFAWRVPSLSHNDHLVLLTLAFVCLFAAGGFLFLGQKWMAAAAFPFAFLIFMVPMPDAMADALGTALKLASAEAGNLFFEITGTPVLRDGTIFQLPGMTIEVGQACSGIRSSFILLITSLLAANLFLKSTWRRAVLVCFVIPLGILRNGFRVWVVATLCIHYGPEMLHSFIHRRGGPLFFALSLIPLFLLLWWLRRGEAATGSQPAPSHGAPAK